MWIPLTGCLFGLLTGMRHALEPDHLAAVSTFVASDGGGRRTVGFATAWGAGHAAMLLLVASALFLLGAGVPERLSDTFELVVSVMLIGLGARGLLRSNHGRHGHARGAPGARLPFLVGLVHGLAGSGALTALVAARLSSPGLGVLFIALYAAGSALGMAALALALGAPLARLVGGGRLVGALTVTSSLGSLAVGVLWAAPIVQRLV